MDSNLPPSTLSESNPNHYLNRYHETISKLNEEIKKL